MTIFFLGAGFSRPAGLPLGDGLWLEVIEAAKLHGLYEKSLEYSIYEYLDYYNAKSGKNINEEKIKLEEFMSYLDIDCHLMLHGGDYSAPEETFRNLIAYVIHNHERRVTEYQYKIYEQFAERLDSNDIIFTFNYDTILENTLRRKNLPYRLYQSRYRYDERAKTLVLDWKDEVAIYKMHGSINWFDKSDYQEWKDQWLRIDYHKEPPYIVFDGTINNDEIHRLLDEPFQPNDPLKDVYLVKNLDKYFDLYFGRRDRIISDSPFIIAPSHQKLINLSYLSDFWYRFSTSGGLTNKIAIIGFSLPAHDEYIRQPLYWFIRNFQKYHVSSIGKKSKLKIIDFKNNRDEIDAFKENYQFVDQSITDFYFDGFSEEALDFIFSEE